MTRPLAAAELPQAARLAAEAFIDDAGTAYIIPDRAKRPRLLPILMEANLRADLAAGAELWTGESAQAPGSLAGLSVWYPAGAKPPSTWQWLANAGAGLGLLFSSLAPYRGLALIHAIDAARPPGMAYLKMLCVAPAAQGQGVGGALLSRLTERARLERTPLYLETFKRANVDYYARSGFALAKEIKTGGLPPFWTMRLSA